MTNKTATRSPVEKTASKQCKSNREMEKVTRNLRRHQYVEATAIGGKRKVDRVNRLRFLAQNEK